jgi:hypothetical protein
MEEAYVNIGKNIWKDILLLLCDGLFCISYDMHFIESGSYIKKCTIFIEQA